jgi:hypothetical protein
MLLKVCDLLNTFFQAFLFVWICNSIAYKENKISKVKFITLMTLIFIITVTVTYSNVNIPMANFVLVNIILLFCLFFYRKSILDAFIGVGLAYSIMVIQGYLLLTFYQNVVVNLNLKISSQVQMFLFIYIPIWISYYFIYRVRKNIFNAAIYLKSIKHAQISILIIDYALIFVDTLRIEWTSHNMEVVFKAILYLLTLVVFIFAVIYFANINDKSKEVEMLNTALSEKITELKKIKHDYGSEISGLYGLYQLGKVDRIGALLKSIVEKNQAVNTAVDVTVEATPIVASVLQTALNKGIDVIVFDSGDYEALNITDNDLLKLLSNIIKNSIDVLDGVENPIIKFKSYNSYNGISMSIVNNGPEIPKEVKNKIFQSGFTTKEDKNGDRGFGLSIVKDIINKCNGEIKIESNQEWTKFNMEIPYKIS